MLIGFIKRVATTYTITNRRLNIKRGIVSREIQETRLERVQNVNYRQSVYQRLMQIGDVDFDTAATDDYDFVFYGVADPGDVVHQVDRATGANAAGSHGLGEPQPPLATPEAAARSVRLRRGVTRPRPAASRRASARSVRSQVKSSSSRPKWP